MKNEKSSLLGGILKVGVAAAAISVAWGYGSYHVATGRDGRILEPILKKELGGNIGEEIRSVLKEGEEFMRSHVTEEVSITSRDGLKLVGHLMENTDMAEPKGIFLLIHGYRSSGFKDFSGIAQALYERGFSLLAVDQRAQGESEGEQISLGVNERYDAVEWAAALGERFPDLPVIPYGISMGATTIMMACEVGWSDNVKALIVDCGYTSPGAISRILQKKLVHMPPFPVYYAANAWTKHLAHYDMDGLTTTDALRCLPKDHIPVLLVHGKADDFVPYAMGEENRTAFREDDPMFEMLSVENAGHGRSCVVDPEGYLAAVGRTLTKAGIAVSLHKENL